MARLKKSFLSDKTTAFDNTENNTLYNSLSGKVSVIIGRGVLRKEFVKMPALLGNRI